MSGGREFLKRKNSRPPKVRSSETETKVQKAGFHQGPRKFKHFWLVAHAEELRCVVAASIIQAAETAFGEVNRFAMSVKELPDNPKYMLARDRMAFLDTFVEQHRKKTKFAISAKVIPSVKVEEEGEGEEE